MLFTEADIYTPKLPNRLISRSKGLAVSWFGKPCTPSDPRAALWSFEGAVIAAITRCASRDLDTASIFKTWQTDTYGVFMEWAMQFIAIMELPRSWTERCEIGPDPAPNGMVTRQDVINRCMWVLRWADHPSTKDEEVKLLIESLLESRIHDMQKEVEDSGM